MSELEHLLSELKRRRVFRTAAAYLAGAFVVLQVADLTFEPLGLPASAYRVLIIIAAIGFPIAVMASWFFDVKRAESRPRLRLKAASALVLFVLICSGFMGYGVVRHWNRADYDGAAVIAVLPFKVIGGTELAYLENGLVEMVSRNIDGAAGLRAIAPDMVLSYAKEKSATSPTEALAEKLAARYLVTGNVTQAGTQVRVTATLHDFKKSDGDPVVVEGTTADLFSIVDRLSAQLLAATRKGQDARLSQAAALTTNSLPALRKYLQGEDFYRKTQYDSAVAQFSEAVTIDSTFALAYYRQALAHANNNAYSQARLSIDKGLRNSTRLTARDQSLMQALREFMDGRYEEAEARYKTLLQDYPGDLEATFSLAQVFYIANGFRGRPFTEGKPLLAQVEAADPEFMCPI
jgi:TolB-like protein